MPRLLLSFSVAAFSLLLLLQARAQFCTEGFPNISKILPLAKNCSSLTSSINCLRNYGGSTHIIPDFNFTCNGTLIKWIAAGRLRTGIIGTNPTLIIWRQHPNSDLDYNIHAEISLLDCNGSPPTHMYADVEQLYKCDLESGVSVQEGDVLGLEMPRTSSDRDLFQLYFDSTSDDPMNLPIIYYRKGSITKYHLSGGSTERALPLVSVVVVPSDTDDDEGSATGTTSSRTEVHSSTTNMSQRNGIALSLEEKLGISAGLAVLFFALTLLLCLQSCVILKNRRRKKRRVSINMNRNSLTTEPYAIVDMSDMDDLGLRAFTKSARTNLEHICLTTNVSYDTAVSLSSHSFYRTQSDDRLYVSSEDRLYVSSEDRLYVSSEDIRRRDGSDLCLATHLAQGIGGELEGGRGNRGVEGSERELGGREEYRGGGDAAAAGKKRCNTNTTLNKPIELDEMDSGIHEHQPDITESTYRSVTESTDGNMEEEENEEPIYY